MPDLKFIFSIFCLSFCFIAGINAQTEELLVTEIQLTNGDSIFRFLYIYNDEKEKSLETKYVLVNETWMRREQSEWLYSNGHCAEQRMRKWVNNEWTSVRTIKFEYNQGNLLSETHYDIQAGAEINRTKTAFTYSQNLKSSKSDFSWVHNSWQINSRYDFHYNGNLLVDTLFQKEYTNGLLTNESKTSFVYNDLSDLKSSQTYVKAGSAWINSTLSSLYYKPTSRLKQSEILKKWDNNYQTWTNYQNVEYRYDSSGNLIEENYQHWNTAFWKNDLRYAYQHNSDGLLEKKTTFLPIYNDYRPVWSIRYLDFKDSKARLIESRNEFWGGETDSLTNTFIPYQFNREMVVNSGSRVKISYIPVAETGILTPTSARNSSQIQVYPNPSKAIFYFNMEKYEVEKWIVTDLNGKQLIIKEQKEKSGVIDLGDYNQGIYLLQVFTPEGIKTQKLIKQNH